VREMTHPPAIVFQGRGSDWAQCDSEPSSVGYGAMSLRDGHWGQISDVRTCHRPRVRPPSRKACRLRTFFGQPGSNMEGGWKGFSNTRHRPKQASAERAGNQKPKGTSNDATLRVRMPELRSRLRGLHPAPRGGGAAEVPRVREGERRARPVLVLGEGERQRRLRDRFGSRLRILVTGPAAPMMISRHKN